MTETNSLVARSTDHGTHVEWFLTGIPAAGQTTLAGARDLYAQAADLMAKNHVEALQEKAYGAKGQRTAILEARREALARNQLDAAVPVTFLQGTPVAGGEFSGFQVWGVAAKKAGQRLLETVERNGVPAGRRWLGPDFRLLHLAAIDGTAADGSLGDCPSCQAKQMLTNVGAALAAHDYTFKQVPRTWIYLARILDWYGEFNRVRTAHYSSAGLSASEGSIFPASTGIQAQSNREECLMDVLAVETKPGSSLAVKPVIRTPRQDKAFSYGSAFSRAVVLEHAGHKTVFISGTAAIDSQGRTTHLGEREAQCLDTLIAIAAILEDQGGGLEHLCQATVFCKDVAVAEAYNSASRRLRLPRIPGVQVIADVCRSDLLVEIEAVAMI